MMLKDKLLICACLNLDHDYVRAFRDHGKGDDSVEGNARFADDSSTVNKPAGRYVSLVCIFA